VGQALDTDAYVQIQQVYASARASRVTAERSGAPVIRQYHGRDNTG